MGMVTFESYTQASIWCWENVTGDCSLIIVDAVGNAAIHEWRHYLPSGYLMEGTAIDW